MLLASRIIPLSLAAIVLILFFGSIAQIIHIVDFENTIEFVNESGEDVRVTPIMSHNVEGNLWGITEKSWIKSNFFFQKQPIGLGMHIKSSSSLKMRSSVYPGFDILILEFPDGSKKISSLHYIKQGPTILDSVVVTAVSSEKTNLPDLPSHLEPLLAGEKIYVDVNAIDKLLIESGQPTILLR